MKSAPALTNQSAACGVKKTRQEHLSARMITAAVASPFQRSPTVAGKRLRNAVADAFLITGWSSDASQSHWCAALLADDAACLRVTGVSVLAGAQSCCYTGGFGHVQTVDRDKNRCRWRSIWDPTELIPLEGKKTAPSSGCGSAAAPVSQSSRVCTVSTSPGPQKTGFLTIPA